MQRFLIFLYSLFLFTLTMNPLIAIDLEDKQDAKNDLRILELLPNLLCPLAVDPCIPKDFIALSPNGTLDAYDWIYWGPKDVLKAYFEDPNSLKVPVFRVKLSANTVQTGPNLFNEDMKKFLKLLKKEDPKGFSSIETQWGNYPVIAITTEKENNFIFLAWVGLNDPKAGWTLMFNLVYPNQKGHPNKEDRQLWESLFTKTTQLKDGEYFKACGQDLQEGYTLVNVGGAKLKMIAEKRQSDGKLQIVVIPDGSNVKFHYLNMIEGGMGAKWKYGEPIVKVSGKIVIKNENNQTIIDHVTSIFIKNVPEFSFKKENENELLIFQKNSHKAD